MNENEEIFIDKTDYELPAKYNREENPMIDKYAIIHPPENDDAFRVETHQSSEVINQTINRWKSYGLKGQLAIYKLVDIVEI